MSCSQRALLLPCLTYYLTFQVFGQSWELSQTDKDLRSLMSSAWASFCASGDPAPPGAGYSWSAAAPPGPGAPWQLELSGLQPSMQPANTTWSRIQLWRSLDWQK